MDTIVDLVAEDILVQSVVSFILGVVSDNAKEHRLTIDWVTTITPLSPPPPNASPSPP